MLSALLGVLPPSCKGENPTETESSNTVTYKLEEQKLGADYDEIRSLKISSDGCHMAYVITRGGKSLAVIDGREGPEHDEIGLIELSPTGTRAAYTAKEEGKWFVVVDGQPGSKHDGTKSVVFSPDGRRTAYAAQSGKKWSVVVDSQPGPEYDEVGPPTFSQDSGRMGYTAKLGSTWHAVVDGQPEADFDQIAVGSVTFNRTTAFFESIVFSPDSRRVAYLARKSEKWLMVIDGRPGPEYDEIKRAVFSFDEYGRPDGPSYSLAFSSEGKHVAYAARVDNKWSVIVDG